MGVSNNSKKTIEGLDDVIPPRTAVINQQAPLEEIQDQKDRAAEHDAEVVRQDQESRDAEKSAAVRRVTADPMPAPVPVMVPVVEPKDPLPDKSAVANSDPLPMERDDAAQVELVACNRLVIGARLFEKNTIYDMTETDAKALLRVRLDDGRPAFARYELEAKMTNDQIVRRMPKPQFAQAAMPVRAVSDAGPQSKIIEIGTEQELIDAGLVSVDAAEVVQRNAAAARGEAYDL